MYKSIMHETLIKCEMGLHPFPEDMVIKSCIMHVHHNDIHNEHRGIVLHGGRIMMESSTSEVTMVIKGVADAAQTADQF